MPLSRGARLRPGAAVPRIEHLYLGYVPSEPSQWVSLRWPKSVLFTDVHNNKSSIMAEWDTFEICEIELYGVKRATGN